MNLGYWLGVLSLHLANSPTVPHCQTTVNNRTGPGRGHINTPRVLRRRRHGWAQIIVRVPLTALCALMGILLSPIALNAQPVEDPASSSLPAIAEIGVAGEPEPVIQPAIQDANSDQSVASRMESIFQEIEGLRDVRIRVQSGVVTLTGTVSNQADRDKAEAIAGRFAGVVTVENAIDRSFEVDGNLAPVVEKFSADLRGLARALPLFGVALLVGFIVGGLGYLLAAQDRLWRWLAPNNFLAELIGGAVRVVSIVAGLIVALQILGATALLGLVLGSAGVIGIALGFAVRDTVDNYVSSLMLSIRQPFRANDHVLIGDSEGRVIRLTSRATILMTLDGNHLRIPNATVFKAIILNYTRNPQRRIEFDLGIDSDDDPMQGMQVGLAAVRSLPIVLADPRSHAIIDVVGDSSIILRFFAWIDQRHTDFGKGRSLAIQAAKHALEQAGFVLPEPIYRIRVDGRSQLDPLSALGDASDQAPPKPPRRPDSRLPVDGDTGPDSAVEQLVTEERDESREPDLLDGRRPVE